MFKLTYLAFILQIKNSDTRNNILLSDSIIDINLIHNIY